VTDAEPSSTPLARLLAMAFREMIDGLHERLAADGWSDVRPRYGYVLLAVADEPRTVAEVAALMGTTKQAASKLVEEMEEARYVRRGPHHGDARAKLVAITPRGKKLLAAVVGIYAELEAEWGEILGPDEVERLRTDLERVISAGHDGGLPDVRPT